MNTEKQAGGRASFAGILSYIEDRCLYASLFVTFLTSVFISVDVFARYIFNSPVPGGFEITEEYLMPALVFLAMSAVYARGGHVRVTLLLRYIPPAIMRPINTILDLLGLCFSLLITYGAVINTVRAVQSGEYSNSILAYPLAPAYALVLIGFTILSIRLIYSLLTRAEKPAG